MSEYGQNAGSSRNRPDDRPRQYRAKRRDLDPPRQAAYEALAAVEQKDAFLNLALPRILREKNLNPRDRAFATELAYGVARLQGNLDFVINQCSTHPVDKLDPAVRIIIRMGVYQILHTRVPDHAAVAEAVDMARTLTTDGPAKLTNAVLRAVTRKSPQEWQDMAAALPDVMDSLAALYSHPKWIIHAYEESLRARGDAGLVELLQANNRHPYVTLVARPTGVDRDELADTVEEILETQVAYGKYSPYAITIERGNPGRVPYIQDGRAAVQDEGSQLAALILAQAAQELGGDNTGRWLDLCAGPGGKTALLAGIAAASGQDIKIDANEVAEHRARLVENNVYPFPNVSVHCGDGRSFDAGSDYDLVMVDAPCTGLGALRRRPESRYRRTPSDLADLVTLQEELLTHAIELARPGGLIGYVTCSPHLAETTRMVNTVVSKQPVQIADLSAIATRFNVLDQGQTIQLWPHRHGTDAMFIAGLIKE